MYQVIRALNNNALLVIDKKSKTEKILLGKGIGFGRRTDDILKHSEGAKEYALTPSYGQEDMVSQINGMDPVFLEAAGQLIEEAERIFGKINRDILVLLAEHMSFSARRAKDNIFIANPFLADIKSLYAREFMVAGNARKQLERLTGYRMTEDEMGFIAMHLHSGLVGEAVSETLRSTQIIDASIQMISRETGKPLIADSRSYGGLISQLYDLMERTRTGEGTHLELNEYMKSRYPEAWTVAEKVCNYISNALERRVNRQEIGFLTVYVERFRAE